MTENGRKHFVHFLLSFSTCSLSLLKVKVWFQNSMNEVEEGKRRTARRGRSRKGTGQWKREHSSLQSLSGIAAKFLQQTGDSLANEDSHDSDHSSEHAHLWYRQRGPAPFSGKKCGDGKPYSNIVYTEKGLWPWFLILLSSGIPSLFFMIYRGFTLSATYERCFHREDGGEYSRGVGRVYDSSLCVCFCLHWKLNCYQEQTMKHLYWRCSRVKMQKMNWLWTLQMSEVMGVTVGRYLLSLALTITLLFKNKPWNYFYLKQPQCLKSFLSGLKKCILTLYILPLSHFPVFTTFSNAFILADKNSHSRWQTEPASCIFIHFVIPETISTCLLVFK